jgi:hypothetical protein
MGGENVESIGDFLGFGGIWLDDFFSREGLIPIDSA